MIATERDIFHMPADYHVVPVNCVPGVMGAGLAKEFRDAFPGLATIHAIACSAGTLAIGKVVVVEVGTMGVSRGRRGIGTPVERIILFPTKDNWRDPSRIEYIQSGLNGLGEWLNQNVPEPPEGALGQATVVAFPALGCGLGGLPFERVENAIAGWEARCLPEDICVIVCKPMRNP